MVFLAIFLAYSAFFPEVLSFLPPESTFFPVKLALLGCVPCDVIVDCCELGTVGWSIDSWTAEVFFFCFSFLPIAL